MARPRLVALLFVGAVALAGAAACGSEDTGGTIEPPAGAGAGGNGDGDDGHDGVGTQLGVVVTAEGATLREGTLTCGPEVVGTGFLADPGTAASACALVADDGPARRLLEGRASDVACTEVYGGPEEAEVTGTLEGAAVNAAFDRANGCGIDEWSTFEPLLGAAAS